MRATGNKLAVSLTLHVSRASSTPHLRDSTGKSSKSRDDSAVVESESLIHPVSRNAAVTDDGDRGLPHSVSVVNAVMNATEFVKSALTRPLCDRLIETARAVVNLIAYGLT